jgi:hypothetical protein
MAYQNTLLISHTAVVNNDIEQIQIKNQWGQINRGSVSDFVFLVGALVLGILTQNQTTGLLDGGYLTLYQFSSFRGPHPHPASFMLTQQG